MGRITNSIGIRLGNNLLWINNGIYIKKINCIQYIHFIENIFDLMSLGKVQSKKYLLSKVQLIQKKNNLVVNLYFYKKMNIFFKKNISLLNNILKHKVVLNNKKINYKNVKKNLVEKKLKLYKCFIFPNNQLKKNSYNYLYLYNNFFNEKMVNNYTNIIVYKKLITNIVYNKIINNNFYIYKEKKDIRLLYKLNQKINKSNKINILINKLLNLIINFNNRVDIIKINNIYNIKNNLYKKILKKKINYLNLIKKKKKSLKLFKFFMFRKFIKCLNKNLIRVNKNFNIYKYKYITVNGNYYKKVFKYVYKGIVIYKKNEIKKNNFKLKKKVNINQKYILINFLKTEKMVLLAAKNYFNYNVIFNYFIIGNFNYTSELLTKYVCTKLKQRFTLVQVVQPLVKYLSKLIKKKNLFGYRLELVGRFTRKQRATKMLIKDGTVPLATINKKIDYSQSFVILKDGVGNVKIWLNKTKKFKNSLISFRGI